MDNFWLGFWGICFVSLIVFKILEISSRKKVEPDTTLSDFNKAKYNIAYKNKVEKVKLKIDELKRSNAHNIIAEQIASIIIVDIADSMVEKDRADGKLDDLYSDK